jgi:putative ABC transport system permease protein
MNLMRRFFNRLVNVLRSRRADEELSREVASHLALLEEEHRRRGMTPGEARLAARRAMGSVALAKDLHRDARSFSSLEDLRRDLKHGLRALLRAPAFTASVVLTLALGIGANTAIFSVVNAVLLRPLPYPGADRLVYLVEEFPAADGTGTPDRRPAMDVQSITEFRSQVRTLSDVAVQESTTMTMATSGETVRLMGSRVSPAFLSLLGAHAMLGRILESRDEIAGADVVLLSHDAWERRFAATPDIVGQPVLLDGRSYAVVGVMPRDFRFYPNPEAEFWTPFVLATSDVLMTPVTAQLNDGVSIEAAVAEMTVVLSGLRGSSEPARFSIVRVQDQMVAPVRTALLVLACAVAFVLLIACANVAHLILARLSTRAREIAIRRALGAGAGRIARLFLAESLVLAMTGGALGIGLAIGGVRLLRVLGTSLPRADASSGVTIPRLGEVSVDTTALVFALVVSVVAAVVFGLTPIYGRRRLPAADTLRGAPALSGFDLQHRHRVRGFLVVCEIGLAMMLLVGATLMMTSFVKLATVNPGYDPTGVVTFQVTVPEGRDMATFSESLVARFQSLPGVRAAGYSTDGLMTRGRGRFPLRSTPGRERPGPNEPTADPAYVSKDYLEAMGIVIRSGRGFEDSDRLGSPQVMLVNRSLVRSGMVGANPIGTRVYALFRDPWEIVGVVEDVRTEALDAEPYPQFFVNLRQVPGFPFSEFRPHFALRTDGDTTAILSNLRAIVRQVEPRASVDNVATADQIVWNSIARPRFYTVLLGLFAIVAVVLAAVGIFGLMAYLVAQRTREIGIRMALGAQRSEVMRGVLGQSAILIVIGVGIGLAAAAGLTRYLEGMLFGLAPLDPATFAAASVLFVVVALIASFVPARRATRVDPLVALRTE